MYPTGSVNRNMEFLLDEKHITRIKASHKIWAPIPSRNRAFFYWPGIGDCLLGSDGGGGGAQFQIARDWHKCLARDHLVNVNGARSMVAANGIMQCSFDLKGQVGEKKQGDGKNGGDPWFRMELQTMGETFSLYVDTMTFNAHQKGQPIHAVGTVGKNYKGFLELKPTSIVSLK